MELNNTQLKQLNDALLSAFPIEFELKKMVRIRLEEWLDDIAPGSQLPERVMNLTKWAVEQGRLDDLIRGAHIYNPANRQLYDFVQQYEEEKDREEPGFKKRK